MTEAGVEPRSPLPAGWELPAPGQVWTTPGAAPPPPVGPVWAPPPLGGPAQAPRQKAARRTAALSVTIAVLLGLIALVSLSMASAFAHRADVIEGFAGLSFDELAAAESTALEADARLVGGAVLLVLLVIPTGILWLIWQRRFVRNAAPFAPISPKLGWGTWGWFVPIACMFMPQSQLANAARSSDPAQLEVGRSGAAPAVLYLWWFAFAGSNLLQIGGNWTRPPDHGLGDPATTIDALARADQIAAMGIGLAAVAAVLGIATVLVCTGRQRRLLATLGVHC